MKNYLVELRLISEHETNFSFLITANSEDEAMKKALILEFYADTQEEAEDSYTIWVGDREIAISKDGYSVKAESAKEIEGEDIEVLKKYLKVFH